MTLIFPLLSLDHENDEILLSMELEIFNSYDILSLIINSLFLAQHGGSNLFILC